MHMKIFNAFPWIIFMLITEVELGIVMASISLIFWTKRALMLAVPRASVGAPFPKTANEGNCLKNPTNVYCSRRTQITAKSCYPQIKGITQTNEVVWFTCMVGLSVFSWSFVYHACHQMGFLIQDLHFQYLLWLKTSPSVRDWTKIKMLLVGSSSESLPFVNGN